MAAKKMRAGPKASALPNHVRVNARGTPAFTIRIAVALTAAKHRGSTGRRAATPLPLFLGRYFSAVTSLRETLRPALYDHVRRKQRDEGGLLKAFTVLAALALLGPISSAGAADTRILFLAGPRDHGAPGRHEYERDLRTLAQSFERSTNLPGVTTQVIVGSLPRDLEAVREAAVIVIDSSSDRDENELHPLFPPNPSTNGRGYDAETTAYLQQL